MKTPVGIRIDTPVKEWIQEKATKQRTSMSEILRQIVYEAFNAAHGAEKR